MNNENTLSRLDCRELIDGLPGAIYLCDKEGRITFYNEAAAELWGRKPILGKDLWCGSWKIFNTDGTSMPIDTCPMAITLKGGKAVKGQEIIVERPDGLRVNVLPHPKPIFGSDGKMIGAINMLVDISEKRQKEQALRVSENKYRNLSESLEIKIKDRTKTLIKSEERYHKMIEEVQDYAILLLDTDGTILNWNKGAEKIKGYSEKEILGKNFRVFYVPSDREAKLPEHLINIAKEQGRAMHEGWRLRKDGTTFWGSIVITALHDDDNNIIGFSKVTRDLTEMKLADDKLKQYAKDLELQNKELEQFAYVASHDLQEPLRKIQTFANLLERDVDDKEAFQHKLNKIHTSAQRMATLIKDILKYSKLSRIDDELVDVELNEIIANVKEDYEVYIEQKNATINTSKLPVIKGIPLQLHQLFTNLIDNSFKFNDGAPVINISYKIEKISLTSDLPLNPGNTYHKITFQDNGIGFESQYTDQIFKLFQRLNTAKTGSGIGLSLCKKIVELHNGHIAVSSVPGKGTTFNIYLPYSIENA